MFAEALIRVYSSLGMYRLTDDPQQVSSYSCPLASVGVTPSSSTKAPCSIQASNRINISHTPVPSCVCLESMLGVRVCPVSDRDCVSGYRLVDS